MWAKATDTRSRTIVQRSQAVHFISSPLGRARAVFDVVSGWLLMSKKGLCTTACRCLFLSQASTEAEWNSVVEDAVLHKGFEDVLGKAKNDFQSVNYRKRGTRERFHRGSGHGRHDTRHVAMVHSVHQFSDVWHWIG